MLIVEYGYYLFDILLCSINVLLIFQARVIACIQQRMDSDSLSCSLDLLKHPCKYWRMVFIAMATAKQTLGKPIHGQTAQANYMQ